MNSVNGTDQLSIYCLDELKRLSDGDHEFVIEILETIIEACPGVAASLETQFQASDTKALAFTLHKFKSTVHILGNAHLNALIADLESKATNKVSEESFRNGIENLIAAIRVLTERLSAEAKTIKPAIS